MSDNTTSNYIGKTPPNPLEKNSDESGKFSAFIGGAYSRIYNKDNNSNKSFMNQTPPDNRDEAFTYKPSKEAVKQKLMDELYEDLNEQCKRDIKFTAAKTVEEKVNLLYQEMQSVNKACFNIQKMMIENL